MQAKPLGVGSSFYRFCAGSSNTQAIYPTSSLITCASSTPVRRWSNPWYL